MYKKPVAVHGVAGNHHGDLGEREIRRGPLGA